MRGLAVFISDIRNCERTRGGTGRGGAGGPRACAPGQLPDPGEDWGKGTGGGGRGLAAGGRPAEGKGLEPWGGALPARQGSAGLSLAGGSSRSREGSGGNCGGGGGGLIAGWPLNGPQPAPCLGISACLARRVGRACVDAGGEMGIFWEKTGVSACCRARGRAMLAGDAPEIVWRRFWKGVGSVEMKCPGFVRSWDLKSFGETEEATVRKR